MHAFPAGVLHRQHGFWALSFQEHIVPRVAAYCPVDPALLIAVDLDGNTTEDFLNYGATKAKYDQEVCYKWLARRTVLPSPNLSIKQIENAGKASKEKNKEALVSSLCSLFEGYNTKLLNDLMEDLKGNKSHCTADAPKHCSLGKQGRDAHIGAALNVRKRLFKTIAHKPRKSNPSISYSNNQQQAWAVRARSSNNRSLFQLSPSGHCLKGGAGCTRLAKEAYGLLADAGSSDLGNESDDAAGRSFPVPIVVVEPPGIDDAPVLASDDSDSLVDWSHGSSSADCSASDPEVG